MTPLPNTKLIDVLDLAERLRPGYVESLGSPDPAFLRGLFSPAQESPDFIRDIYSVVWGTPRNVAEQRFMDFVPGYRLIAVSELAQEFRSVNQLALSSHSLFPFLANYSSDYICWQNGRIVLANHDAPDVEILHASGARFLDTVRAFYVEGVYRTDPDGYLDYDYAREQEIGVRCNPGISYWAGG